MSERMSHQMIETLTGAGSKDGWRYNNDALVLIQYLFTLQTATRLGAECAPIHGTKSQCTVQNQNNCVGPHGMWVQGLLLVSARAFILFVPPLHFGCSSLRMLKHNEIQAEATESIRIVKFTTCYSPLMTG